MPLPNQSQPSIYDYLPLSSPAAFHHHDPDTKSFPSPSAPFPPTATIRRSQSCSERLSRFLNAGSVPEGLNQVQQLDMRGSSRKRRLSQHSLGSANRVRFSTNTATHFHFGLPGTYRRRKESRLGRIMVGMMVVVVVEGAIFDCSHQRSLFPPTLQLPR